jgi:hypothetical protein
MWRMTLPTQGPGKFLQGNRTIMPENVKLSVLTAVIKTKLRIHTDKFFSLRQYPGKEAGFRVNTECLTHTAAS